MAKRKKTLKQKIAADMRHQVYSVNDISPVFQISKKEEVSNLISKNYPITSSSVVTSYLKHDILKTSALTGIILLFQILLFLTLRAHILKIPNISY